MDVFCGSLRDLLDDAGDWYCECLSDFPGSLLSRIDILKINDGYGDFGMTEWGIIELSRIKSDWIVWIWMNTNQG